MQIFIKPMEVSDLPETVKGWNLSLPYDQVSERHFEHVILHDPNHEKGAALVAVHDGKIIGFISSVAREGVSGADNRGRPHEKDDGYIKGLFVLDEFRRNGIGSKLLDSVLEYLRSKGKRRVRVITYTGSYFFPGVDLRYEPALRFFENKGFQKDHVIDDVDIDLKDFQISDYQKNAKRRMSDAGVHVEDYDPLMLDEMRKFVEKLNMTAWFPEGWEEWFKEKGNKVVALKGKEIVGWASYHPGGGTGMFGPIGVLKEMRGNGIGSCLLLESILHMKDVGAERAIASWANTPFYLPNGWKICRQYAVFEKNIGE